jgi:hypothetical protein
MDARSDRAEAPLNLDLYALDSNRMQADVQYVHTESPFFFTPDT